MAAGTRKTVKSKPARKTGAPSSATSKNKRPMTAGSGNTPGKAPQSPEAAPSADQPGAGTVTPPAPAGGSQHDVARLPPPEPGDTVGSYVRRHIGFVIAAYTMGNSLTAIGESFQPPMTAIQLRVAIHNDVEMHKMWKAAQDERAHYLVEEATVSALSCGVAKERTDALLKVAEKSAPHLYGAKSRVELTGAEGGPVESKVDMTPTEAYQRMLKGV